MQPGAKGGSLATKGSDGAQKTHECLLGHVCRVAWVAHDRQAQAVDLRLVRFDQLHERTTVARLCAGDDRLGVHKGNNPRMAWPLGGQHRAVGQSFTWPPDQGTSAYVNCA